MNNPSSQTNKPPALLRRIRPEKNERRFYVMQVTSDLFGKTLLWRNWGRIGTQGRQRWDLCHDPNTAAEALNHLVTKKLKRGYRLLST